VTSEKILILQQEKHNSTISQMTTSYTKRKQAHMFTTGHSMSKCGEQEWEGKSTAFSTVLPPEVQAVIPKITARKSQQKAQPGLQLLLAPH